MKNRKLSRTEINLKLLDRYKVDIDKLDFDTLKEFKNKVKELSDGRQKGKVKYKICDIVVVSFLAILGNCNDWDDIHEFAVIKKNWLKKFLMLLSCNF